MDQHVIKMAALGRRFQLGDLYNYRIDHILTEYRCESTFMPSGTQMETGFKLKLMRPDSDTIHKWQHMGLDEHLQASMLAGLIETEVEAEANKLRGASHYVNENFNPAEVTRTFICRAINKKHRLDLPNFLSNIVATNGLSDATHVVVGLAYGAEAYCVLTLNVKCDENDDREKIAKFLNHVSSMMEIALEEKQDEAEFKEQFTNEEKKLVGQMKCRVYADHQIQPVRECGLFNAYKHCLKLVHQVENMEKTVPVVAVLCPLRIVMKANEGLERNFMYRDVDVVLVPRCGKISTELDRVIGTSESIRLSMKKMISRPDFNQFTLVVSKFKDLLKASWRKSIVKARESEDEDDREVERAAHIAETHPLFNIVRLNQWLQFKKAEMEMVDNLDSIKGITFLADKTQLEKELAFSFDSRHTLVLCIPSLDQSSKEILCAMENYVNKNTELVAGDDDSLDDDVLPWHLVTDKKKQVLDKIREMVDFVKKNKQHPENDVQFFILPSKESGKNFGCSYSVYQADNLVKDNLTQLPTSFYNETDIGRCEFNVVRDTGSTLNINQKIDFEREERVIANRKEIVMHPPILIVSDVTQSTANLVWTTSPNGAASVAVSYRIRYWRNGQRSSVHVCFESGETRFRLEDLQPGSTYSINIVATSEDGQETTPSEIIEFTTRQLEEESNPVGVAQNTLSTVVDELKLLRELVTNLKKESDGTSAIERMPLLQGEAKTTIEKEWFDTIEKTYPNVTALENLILRGVGANAENTYGENALHLVCRKNKNENLVDLVRLLVANGVDVNAKDKYGQIALHILCQCNDNKNVIDIVRLLIENGVDIKAKTFEGCTALYFLCRNYQNENLINIVRVFVENGVDVNAKDNSGLTAIYWLCQNYKNENLIDIARLLIQNGVDVKANDSSGQTALYLLCQNYKNENLIDIARLLIQNGVDVKAKDRSGRTALSLLCQNYKNENLIDIVRVFVENGVDVNAKDNNYGVTALHRLCQSYKNENLIDIVRVFVKNGVDVNAKDNWSGKAPRDLIRQSYEKENAKEILKLLGE